MNHDAADLAMFWVGALFVFTPITFFGVILGVWWYKGKQNRRDLTRRSDDRKDLAQRPQRTQRAQRTA
jgi:hypothetical protein